MSHHRLTRSIALTIAVAALAAPAPAAAADQAARALHVRSQALNDRYALAETTSPAERALHLRSQALNERYAADGTPSSPARSIVTTPSGGASANGAIDWTDAGIGAGAMFLGLGLTSLSIYAVMQRRRTDPAWRRAAKAA
jgi:hypothetical protein